MNKAMCVLSLAVASTVAAWLPAAMPRDYSVLRERSVFSRERLRRVSTGPTTRTWSPPVSPVLVGIGQQGESMDAVFETPGTGRVMSLRVNEDLPGGGGRVTAITPEYVEFAPRPDAAPRRVQIGRSLDGSETTLTAATTQPASSEAAPEGEDIVSRMKRRRLQEAGK